LLFPCFFVASSPIANRLVAQPWAMDHAHMLAVVCCPLAIGYWLLAVGCWLLAVVHWTVHWMLAIGYGRHLQITNTNNNTNTL
jgi:hypothetical protein